MLPDCEQWTELREATWGQRRPDDLKKVFNKPELAQKSAKFILQTGFWRNSELCKQLRMKVQSDHTHQPDAEFSISFTVNFQLTPAWKGTSHHRTHPCSGLILADFSFFVADYAAHPCFGLVLAASHPSVVDHVVCSPPGPGPAAFSIHPIKDIPLERLRGMQLSIRRWIDDLLPAGLL